MMDDKDDKDRYIYLGSLSGLNNFRHASALGLTHVVNCTGDVEFPRHKLIKEENMHRFNIASQRSSMYVTSQDTGSSNELLIKMLQFVDTALLDKSSKVFFYCIAGCHRAPGVCQLYLLYSSYKLNIP